MAFQRQQIVHSLFRCGAAMSILATEMERKDIADDRAAAALEKIEARVRELKKEIGHGLND